MAKRNRSQLMACPFEQAMDVLNGKWKGMLVFRLKQQSLRFTEIKKLLPTISNRTLARILDELEEDALIIKEQSQDQGIYKLSAMGLALLPGLQVIRDWGVKYQNKEL